jgi:hypothetical protein
MAAKARVINSATGTQQPGDIYRARRCWVEHVYHKFIRFHQAAKGDELATWEQPDILFAKPRATPRSLRGS